MSSTDEANTENAKDPMTDDEAMTQEGMKQVVLETIEQYCIETTSEYSVLREMGKALKQRCTLVATVISGGKTNFSYKIHVKERPEFAVYAKIAFRYALWNPDPSVEFDLSRTVNEFHMMETVAQLMKAKSKDNSAPLAQPYFVTNVLDGDAKLLVTEWSMTDQQWGQQFQDGHVNMRLVNKMALTLGTLSLQTDIVDPNWNDVVRPCYQSLFPIAKTEFAKLLSSNADKGDTSATNQHDYALQLCHELGQSAFDQIIDNCEHEYLTVRDVLCHNDSHVFNILVHPNKADAADDNTTDPFADKDDFCLVDWEMAIAGPCGKDAGLFQFFPLHCAMCHAVQGNAKQAYHMLDIVMEFWDVYANVLVQDGGKDEAYLHQTMLHAFGIIGVYSFLGLYQLNIGADLLPLKDVSNTLISVAKEAIGAISLTLFDVAYGTHPARNLAYNDLVGYYKDMVHQYIEKLLAVAAANVGSKGAESHRRASSCVSNRRVSDAAAVDEAIYRRLSLLKDDEEKAAKERSRRRSSLASSCRSDVSTVESSQNPLVPEAALF